MIEIPDLTGECIFKAVRSSGKGGQNVNKVSTKVELYFNIRNSNLLSAEQKILLEEKLKNLTNEESEIRIVSDEERSQKRNKDKTIEKLHLLIKKALTPVKKRKPTKIPKSVKEKRLKDKKIRAEIKAGRKNTEDI